MRNNIFGSLSSIGDVEGDIQTMQEWTAPSVLESLFPHDLEVVFECTRVLDIFIQSNESSFKQYTIHDGTPIHFGFSFLASTLTIGVVGTKHEVHLDPMHVLESYRVHDQICSVKIHSPKQSIICDVAFKIVGVDLLYLKDRESDQKFHLFNLKTGDVVESMGDIPAITFNGFNYVSSRWNGLRDLTEFTISIVFRPQDENTNGTLLSTITDGIGMQITWFHSIFTDSGNATYEPVMEEVDIDSDLRHNVFKQGWNEKCIVFDGLCFKEYLNGSLVNQYKTRFLSIRQGTRMTLGAMVNEMDFEGFRGDISEFKIWNYARVV
jgi:hypothetical protein